MSPTFIWAIGALIASYFISTLITPKVETPKPSTLGDFDFPQIDEGTPQCVIFGDVWVPDWHILWFGNLRTSPIESDGNKK